jgi:hypothetical protein
MRRLSLILLLLLATAAMASEGADRQHIRLRVLRGDAPRTSITVKLTFPDGEHTNGTTLTLMTNSEGFVEADIPSTIFWVTVPEENPDVVGREFRFAKIERTTKRWDLRPREWKNSTKETQR